MSEIIYVRLFENLYRFASMLVGSSRVICVIFRGKMMLKDVLVVRCS